MPLTSPTFSITAGPQLTLAEHKQLTHHYLQQYIHTLHTAYQQSFHRSIQYYQQQDQNSVANLQRQLHIAVQQYHHTDYTIQQLKHKHTTDQQQYYTTLVQQYDALQQRHTELEQQLRQKIEDEQQHSIDAVRKWQQLQSLRSNFQKYRRTELQSQQQQAAIALSHGRSSSVSHGRSTHGSPNVRSTKGSYSIDATPGDTTPAAAVTTTDIDQIKQELKLLEQQHCEQLKGITKLERQHNDLIRDQQLQQAKHESDMQLEQQQQQNIQTAHNAQKDEHKQLQHKHQQKVQQLQATYNAMLEQHNKLAADLQQHVHTKASVTDECERILHETKAVEDKTFDYQRQHAEQMVKARQMYRDAVQPGIQTIQSALQTVKQSFEMYVSALAEHDRQRHVDGDVVDPLMEAIASRLTVNKTSVMDLEGHVNAVSEAIAG